jgi:hypothetical protein
LPPPPHPRANPESKAKMPKIGRLRRDLSLTQVAIDNNTRKHLLPPSFLDE